MSRMGSLKMLKKLEFNWGKGIGQKKKISYGMKSWCFGLMAAILVIPKLLD